MCLVADSAEALEAGSSLFEHFGLDPVTTPETGGHAIRFVIKRREPPATPPTDAVVSHHMDLEVRSSDDLLFVDGGDTAARIDLAAESATLFTQSWPTGPTAGRPYLIFVFTLLTLLRRRGLIPLHAAAVEQHGAGILLVAPSGSGKSTLSLMSLRAGWKIVSDDSVLLRQARRGGVIAHGLRRDLFLREPEADFPELADAWATTLDIDRNKRRLVVERTFPGRVVPECTPRVILLPELSGRSESRLLPCSPDETLFRLLDHSTLADLERGAARVHVEVLGKLVRQARSFVLEAAPDLLEEPDRIRLLVEPLIADSDASGPAAGPGDMNWAPA